MFSFRKGEVIEVKDERLGVNITTRVLSFKYDCILGKYTEVEFGNAQPKLSDLMADINAQTDKGFIRHGNKEFKNGNYSEAEVNYRKSLDKEYNPKAQIGRAHV